MAKCLKHGWEMIPTECSRCLGEGVIFVEDDLTGEDTPIKCHCCFGTGEGGEQCEACLEEYLASLEEL